MDYHVSMAVIHSWDNLLEKSASLLFLKLQLTNKQKSKMSQAHYTKIWNKDDMKIMEVWVLPTVEAIVHCNMSEQSTLHTLTSVRIF